MLVSYTRHDDNANQSQTKDRQGRFVVYFIIIYLPFEFVYMHICAWCVV